MRLFTTLCGALYQSTHTYTPASTEPLHIIVLTFDFETRSKLESWPIVKPVRSSALLYYIDVFTVCSWNNNTANVNS